MQKKSNLYYKLITKNNSGFFSIQFIFFISLITLIILGYNYIFYAQKEKDQFRKVCYFDLVNIQKRLILSEKQLFLLNSESTILRSRLNILYIELAAAVASSNAALVTKLGIDIWQIQNLQNKLDKIQKLIILTSQAQLKINLGKLNYELESKKLSENLIWEKFITSTKVYRLKLNTELAVQSDSIGGQAPNYELKSDYERLQKLELILHHHFVNNKKNQTVLNIEKDFNLICAVSFKKENNEWELEIKQDKYL